MIPEPLGHALEATGYLLNGEPAAPSVTLAGSGRQGTLAGLGAPGWLPSFGPDAWWQSNPNVDVWGISAANLTVYFKFVDELDTAPVAEWQREIWNRGFAPLLWLVSPDRIELYNGFGPPQGPSDAATNRLGTFLRIDEKLAELDALAGRFAMETGQFWRERLDVNRKTSVDGRLLRDLRHLERHLVNDNLSRADAQGLIGRSIFTRYLTDRGIVTEERMMELCGRAHLSEVLRDREATGRLFAWLRKTFNGDMFPPSRESVPAAEHLDWVARFLTGEDMETGQLSFFPYRFEVIPVELISAIYEQFVHSSSAESQGDTGTNPARTEGVYYTPLAAVSLVLDEVFNGLTGQESVLDLACGSGVFLVEALRRLVYLKSNGGTPSRETIRETLYEQVYGVDISDAAVRIATFSLYLVVLDLDPDPHPPEALRFEPLQGNTMLVGDARTIDRTRDGRAVLKNGAGLRKFDVIVGNPPWSYKGKAGTSDRRATGSRAPRQPRGQSLDFVVRASEFSHDETRFGMILSAMPFFGRSSTGAKAVHSVVDALAPVTLVNLSDLSNWLFPKADMPAVALLARHRKQRADRMTLVHAHWSLRSEQSHTIEIAPSDITSLPIASWKRNAGLFKAAFMGRRPDLLLLDELWEKYKSLETCLRKVNASLKSGIKRGNRSRDATFLKGLPFIRKECVEPFSVTDDLPAFDQDRAEWPRERRIYDAPLLLAAKFMRVNPRPLVVAAVVERDAAYADAFYGVSFSGVRPEAAHLVAGILGSALASWYFLMTGSQFGLWIQQLLLRDVATMPMLDIEECLESDAGKRIVQLSYNFHQQSLNAGDWEALDDAVFDLYQLDEPDRIVVRDGLFRASWQWKTGRLESIASADTNDLEAYARAFLSTMDAWLSASNRRRMRAEIYEMARDAPLRAIRFVLENTPGPSVMEIIRPDGPLSSVLAQIGERTEVQLTNELVGLRELRVHAKDEVSIIKPAARRHWLGVCGLEDADAVVKDSVYGHRTT